MKRTIRIEYLARHVVDGKTLASAQRGTRKQAVGALGKPAGGTVEVFRLELRPHPTAKWWTEHNRVRVGGAA